VSKFWKKPPWLIALVIVIACLVWPHDLPWLVAISVAMACYLWHAIIYRWQTAIGQKPGAIPLHPAPLSTMLAANFILNPNNNARQYQVPAGNRKNAHRRSFGR
jgi:hypothetical protein